MSSTVEERATRLMLDIGRMQDELATPAISPLTRLAVPKLSSQPARDLKTAVDKFRLFLWAYLDSWSAKDDVESKLRNIRLDCICDMLAVLYRDFREHGVPSGAGGERLFLEVGRMADLLGTKPPAEP